MVSIMRDMINSRPFLMKKKTKLVFLWKIHDPHLFKSVGTR